MRLRAAVLVVSLGLASSLFAAETMNDRWNLADVYASTDAWKADAARLESQLKEIAACSGTLAESVGRFKSCLDLSTDMLKRYYRLYLFSSQTLAEDTGSAPSLELNQRAQVLGTRVSEATAFFRPEVLELGKEKIDAYLAAEPSLGVYRHYLDDILRSAPHTLPRDQEQLVASYGLITGTAVNVYGILSNAELPWPTITLSTGEQATLDQAGYGKYREASDREDRKRVFDAFWGKWKEFERTFGVTLYSSLKAATVQSKVRKYPDSLAAAMDGDRLPVAVYDTLVKEANAGLPTLHRYFRLRAKMLGVQEMRYYDIYPPLVESKLEFPYEKGRQMMLDSVRPLGEGYAAVMRGGLDSRWMDVYPRPRKQAGAHMAGFGYDVHPYLLMNYTGNYESVSTMAHEWGHAMHSSLANKAQSFVNSGYATFTAEIASTVNEALLLDHALKTAKDDDERLLYLGSALENLRATFYRQTMFAEFEREIHARVDRGESLTGASLTRLYGDILRRYHGDAEGVVKIDDLYCVEWAYIPHFYRNFYVFQYSTSLAAASQFADGILKGDSAVRERYLTMLKAGGSDYPYELVKTAGVDLATPAPYRSLIARMNRIMDDIEAILARRGK